MKRKISELFLLSKYRNYLSRHPRLKFLFLELTSRCNLHCLHCGSDCGPGGEGEILEKNDYFNFLADLVKSFEPQEAMLCITGGEPLMRKDIFEIMAFAVSLGFRWGMTTNGTLITPAVVEKLHTSGMETISVSLDGLSDAHDWLRNKKGSFQQAVNGVRLLVRSGFFRHVQVTTVVHKRNISQLDQMIPLIVGLGCQSWRLVNIEPIGRANANRQLLWDGGDFRKLFDFIHTNRHDTTLGFDVTYGCSHYLMPELEKELRDYYFICGSGVYVASILANGDIFSCLDIERRPELIQGNILRDDFAKIWKRGFQVFRRDRTKLSKKCNNCEERIFCRGDSTHTWDYNHNEPLICMKDVIIKRD